MNIHELSEQIGYSESSIKKNFNRTLNMVRKNKGLFIIKEGQGKNAEYFLVPDEGQPIPQKIDFNKRLIGKRFGHLTVIEDTGKREHRAIVWKCKCDCGNIKETTSSHLNSGHVKTCGQNNCPYHCYYEDLTGQRFGKLIALKPIGMKDNTHMYWLCKCDCGNLKEVASSHLKKGNIKSCGCITTSIGESNIETVLKANNIQYRREVSFNNLKNIRSLRYDFGIYENDKLIRLIEFDGIQHFQEQNYFTHSLEETKQNDNIKNNYCKTNNIPLVRIPYWERDNITLEMLLGDKYLI